MAARKRTRGEREHDLTIVAELYLTGLPHHAIAEKLSSERAYNLSRSQITRDIRTIHEQWREAYLVDFHTAQVRELARLDKLEAEYWCAWERSQQDASSSEDVDIEDTQYDKPSFSRKKHVDKTEQRDGSAVYLQGIERCIEKRCRILGLHAPEKHQINWRAEATKMGINPDKLEEKLVSVFLDSANKKTEDPDQLNPPRLAPGAKK